MKNHIQTRTRYAGPIAEAGVHPHSLVEQGFATDEALAAMLDRYPAELFDINLYDYDDEGQASLRTGVRGKLDGAGLLAAIQQGRLWVNLRSVETGWPELWAAAMGGTELMKHALASRMPEGLLDNFQIFISRVHEDLDPNKIKIYWHQDLPWDPAATHLKETWQQFDHIVYNSNWQADMFNKYLGVPYHRSSVLENAIEPIEYKVKPSRTDGIIRIIYHTTPHRGLELLVELLPVRQSVIERCLYIWLVTYHDTSLRLSDAGNQFIYIGFILFASIEINCMT